MTLFSLQNLNRSFQVTFSKLTTKFNVTKYSLRLLKKRKSYNTVGNSRYNGESALRLISHSQEVCK